MPRIHPVDPAANTAAAQLATARKMFGGTPNMFTTAAHSPAALEGMLGLFASLGKASLGPKVGEQIAIAVAQENGCGYCLSAHTAIGKMHGLGAGELDAARRATATDHKASAALRLATEVNRTRGHVDDGVLSAAHAAGLSDGEIVEVVAHVALNVFTNYFNNVAEPEIDFPVVALDAAA